jgi:hypothetical protein
MNHSEKQLAKDLKKSRNVLVEISLHPQGHNAKLDPNKATNLCEVVTNGMSATYGGICMKHFDKMSKKYSQEAFEKRMAKAKRNRPIENDLEAFENKASVGEIENDVTSEELKEELDSIK